MDGMATTKPATVVIKAAETPGAIVSNAALCDWPTIAKVSITPHTVPSRPRNGPPLTALARRHDLIPVMIKDRFERSFPLHNGLLYIEDPESGEIRAVDGGDPAVRESYRQAAEAEYQRRLRYFRRIKVDCLELATDGNYLKPLNLFFKRQQKKVLRG